jgi:putative transcriptional regulator
MEKKTYKSDAFAAGHEAADDLRALGLISNERMAYYDEACLETIPDYTPERVRFIRSREDLTQSQLARHLNVSLKTVQSWEARNPKHPSGSAAKLLTLIERYGTRIVAG